MKLHFKGSRIAFLALAVLGSLNRCNGGDDKLLVPAGFRVDQFADDDLAHDIHCMTVDSQGRVVVAGPGYIRILIDSDGDGKADTFKQFADGPEKGAQSIYSLGSSMLCSGGEGVTIYHDKNLDDKADGPPTTILKIAAGGEHHVHSIQRGPDGWWYVIAGNMAGVSSGYAVLATSPIKKPNAGVLLRLKPDLSAGEVVSDGFRNAYDFAFTKSGDVFTFDSDGERDVSLPWYRPCRVFHVTPASNAGWVSRSWKHPDDFPGMPPTVAEFGRGSPTGVACYRHSQFPSRYHNSLFMLDWTFGRILTMSLEEKSGGWKASPAVFAKGSGNFGFAPTDIEVGPNGELFVCVGGRGTRGRVFRIVSELNPLPSRRKPKKDEASQVDFVLQSPQPESSWSRELWRPIARKLNPSAFINASADDGRPDDERVRAIEILLTEFDGIDNETAAKLTNAKSAAVRARTAWAVGRTKPESPNADVILKLLNDRSPLVVRFALEALLTVTDEGLIEKCLPRLAVSLGSPKASVRAAAINVMRRLTVEQQEQLLALLEENLPAQVRLLLGVLTRESVADPDIASLAVRSLQEASLANNQLESLRLLQMAMGDVGPASDKVVGGMARAAVKGVPAFESYTCKRLNGVAGVGQSPGLVKKVVAEKYPSGNPAVDRELLRTIAIVGDCDQAFLGRALGAITAESNPTDDVHVLATIACLQQSRTEAQTKATAQALVNLDVKIIQLGMKQDSNWDDRIGEIFEALCRVDVNLMNVIGQQPEFGLPGHVLYLKKISAGRTQTAIDGFVRQIEQRDDYAWTTDVIFVLGNSTNPAHRELVRAQVNNSSVADAVFTVLARKPDPRDRDIYVKGLGSSVPKAVSTCLTALLKLPRSNSSTEQYQLLALARRLTHTEEEFRQRELVVRLLQNNTSHSNGFVFGRAGYRTQSEAMNLWDSFLAKRYPNAKPKMEGGLVAERVMEVLDEVKWANGDVQRGKQLFTKLLCARCHGGRKAMGPDLQGVAKRFSRRDLFAAIVDPNRDVSNRYQTTTVETKAGKAYSGLVVYESVDGILLRDSEQNSIRINAEDIESKAKQRVSLMPNGLLRTVTRQDLADLNAYLGQL